MPAGIITWAEIDLDAVARNVSSFKRHVGENVEVMAVVKANAYGHGAVPVGKAALEAGATRLAVHRAAEGGELRQARIEAPILVMGYTPPDDARAVVRWRLTPSVITLEAARALSQEAAAVGVTLPVHIKVDTGMGRWGLLPDEVVEFVRALQNLPSLRLEGIFTHFATADCTNASHVVSQLEVFNRVLADVRHAGFDVPVVHAANSAATMRLPAAHFKAVRIGIAMYGMEPSSEWQSVFPLQPVLTLKSTVNRVRRLPAGSGISYGRTFVTQRSTLAALVPVGYGDGYHRSLSNRGCVLIRGQRAPILGRVCMDQCVVDVTHIPGVQQDDEVVLIGRQGQEVISAEEVARLAGTINYEVTTSLLPRVSRLYLREGRVVSAASLADSNADLGQPGSLPRGGGAGQAFDRPSP
jgi:alanine racemase